MNKYKTECLELTEINVFMLIVTRS